MGNWRQSGQLSFCAGITKLQASARSKVGLLTAPSEGYPSSSEGHQVDTRAGPFESHWSYPALASSAQTRQLTPSPWETTDKHRLGYVLLVDTLVSEQMTLRGQAEEMDLTDNYPQFPSPCLLMIPSILRVEGAMTDLQSCVSPLLLLSERSLRSPLSRVSAL